ncbi:MAG: hypothetical protein H7X83_00930 [Verrucomicrobia bacterium]|nr:hypothetical protein [Deltaproteobacteria bacterium]
MGDILGGNESVAVDPQQERLYEIYPSMRPVQPAAKVESPNDKLIAEAKAEGIPMISLPEEIQGERMYGFDPGEGEPVADYEAHGLSSFFDQRVTAARCIKDDDELANLATARTATNQAFKDYAVGPVRAAEIMTLASRYEQGPGVGENIEAVNANVVGKLKAEYGSKTDKMLAGAKRVSDDLCRRIHGFSRIVDAGLGSDESSLKR